MLERGFLPGSFQKSRNVILLKAINFFSQGKLIMKSAIGVDIGGTNIKVVLVSEEGDVLASEKNVKKYLDDYLVSAATSLVKNYLENADEIDYESIVAGYLPRSG